MLSVWKLRVGVEAYYLAQVASGLDDYYTGAGEAVGVWTGHGAAGLGLAGEVDAADLRAVLAGLAPDTGLSPNGEKIRPHRRRVPGFDLTFSVPKSVSVVWALGDPLVKGAVLDAAEAALDDTLAWLERDAIYVRRGSNDAKLRSSLGEGWGTRRMVTGGVVAARFRHRSSRAGDPHLHWHVLVANMAQGIDGRWTALDGTALYAAKRTAGVLFQASLRRELTERLGVSWGPLRNDSAEVMGVPRRVLREFSQRREQIAEWMDSHGTSGPGAADEAMLATRASKPEVSFETLQIDWEARAEALGFGPADVDVLVADSSANVRPAEPNDDDEGFGRWLDDLLERRLTLHESVFTRHDLTQAVAGALPAGATAATVEQVVQRCLANEAIVTIAPAASTIMGPLASRIDVSGVRYSSRRLLELEAQMMRELTGERDVPEIPSVLVAEALVRRSSIGFDQANAVQLLCQPDAVQVLVGRPGTGKTYTLRTVADIHEAAGRTVIGLAPSARAARELHDGAGIESRTIASFLHHPPVLTSLSLVIVDEAGMAGTRDLAAITELLTSAGAKLILVGDHHQLPEIDAGGTFRALHEALVVVPGRAAELTVNRRQRHRWEHDALDLLRTGDITGAWAAYQDHDRVTLSATPEELRDTLVGDWVRLRAVPRPDGRCPEVVVLAGTRAETVALNRAIRDHLTTAGLLQGPAVVAGSRRFQAGDRVVLLRNDPHQHDVDGLAVRVDNGMLATIATLDPTLGTVTVEVAGLARPVLLDADYVAGHLNHGYALTVHKAQGMTCDHVLVAGPHGLNREAGYVALSRARDTAHLYATTRQDTEMAERHAKGIPLPAETPEDPERQLLARLSRSGAKHLAIALNPDALTVEALTQLPIDSLIVGERRARDIAATASCQPPDDGTLQAAVAFRAYADVGRRVRVIDRDNVGTIDTIDDTTGTCVVHFENDRGRSSTRRFEWHQLVVIDHPEPVELTANALDRLDEISADCDQSHQLWTEHHRTNGVTPGDAARYRAAIDRIVERNAAALRADPPTWIVNVLGHRPSDPACAHVWDDTIDRIAEHTTLHEIPAAALLSSTTLDGLPLQLVDDLVAAVEYLTSDRRLPDHRTTPGPIERADRIAELRRLADTAPLVEPAAIEATPAAQGVTSDSQIERRQWILEHWPHLVELEQLQRLDDADPLAAWPTARPPEVTAILEELRRLAPTPGPHEERSLKQLDIALAATSPTAHIDELQRRIADQGTRAPTGREVLPKQEPADLVRVRRDLLVARRALREQQLLEHYIGPKVSLEQSRANRANHVVRTALTLQPGWVVELVEQLHRSQALEGLDPRQIAIMVAGEAVGRDGGDRADLRSVVLDQDPGRTVSPGIDRG